MDSYQYDRDDDEWWIDAAPYPGPYEQPSPAEIIKQFGVTAREASAAFSAFAKVRPIFMTPPRQSDYILWPPPESTSEKTEYERTKDISDPRERALEMKKFRSSGPGSLSKRIFSNDGKRLF